MDQEAFERSGKKLIAAVRRAEWWARIVTLWLVLLTIGFTYLVLR